MPAYLESMAYRANSATPWHGEGVQIDASAGIHEWLDRSGLNWKVVTQPIDIPGSNASSSAHYRAIMRQTDGQVYQIATERYTPTQNDEILGFFRDFAESGQMQIETVGSLKQGAVVWALASIGESFQLGAADKVNGYVLLANSHDGSMSVCASTTSIRVVCWNTLSAAIGARGQRAQFKMRHTRKFGAAEQREALRCMKLARDEFAGLHETAHQLSSAPATNAELLSWCYKLTDPKDSREILKPTAQPAIAAPAADDAAGLLDAMLAYHDGGATRGPRGVEIKDLNKAGRSVLSSILRSPGADMDAARGTWWGAVNGATHYADHVVKPRNGASRLDSAWFGHGAGLKQRAVDLALSYATQPEVSR